MNVFDWHAHEMLYGYVAAVIAGFLLTAIPNWTGRLPVCGWPLAGLALLYYSLDLGMAYVYTFAMLALLAGHTAMSARMVSDIKVLYLLGITLQILRMRKAAQPT